MKRLSTSVRGVALSYLLLLTTVVSLVGCSANPQWIAIPGSPPEVPAANLPVGMRQHNWADATGSGSCVIASSIYHLRWCNQEKIAAKFRASYAGGQTSSSIQKKWADNGIPFISIPTLGDPEFLEWASRTRRGAIIWYFPSHCVHFCGFGVFQGEEYAFLNDNNRETYFIRIPKREFISQWRGYGGYACTALLSPAPSIPTPGYLVQQ